MNDVSKDRSAALRIFISYSRHDSGFAQKLQSALTAAGYETRLDAKDILPGEDWQRRLDAMILEADVVLFIVSPTSAASTHCNWEVTRTIELKKALCPVVWRPTPNEQLPAHLTKINYVFFDAYERSNATDELAFSAAFEQLLIALNLGKFVWLREHTKWVERAVTWNQAEPPRPSGRLLGGDEIIAAETWARLKPSDAPGIPLVLEQFLAESRAAEDRNAEEQWRRKIHIAQATQRLVRLLARDARINGKTESAARLALAGEPSKADRARGVPVDPLLRLELAATAHIMADGPLSMMGSKRKPAIVSAGLAGLMIEPHVDSSPFFSLPRHKGQQAKSLSPLAVIKTSKLEQIAFSPNGNFLAIAEHDRGVTTYNLATCEVAKETPSPGRTLALSWTTENPRIVADHDRAVSLIDFNTGDSISTLVSNADFTFAHIAGNHVFISEMARTAVYDSQTGTLVREHPKRAAGKLNKSGRILAFREIDRFKVVDIANSATIGDIEAKDGFIGATTEDGKKLIVHLEQGRLVVRDTDGGSELSRYLEHYDSVIDVRLSPDERSALSVASDGTVRLWDIDTGYEIAAFDVVAPRAIAWSCDGSRIAVGDEETVHVWDVSWAAFARDEVLACLVAHDLAKHDLGLLTDEEQLQLRPILGEVEPDIVSRWLDETPHETEIQKIRSLWQANADLATPQRERDQERQAHTRAEESKRKNAELNKLPPPRSGAATALALAAAAAAMPTIATAPPPPPPPPPKRTPKRAITAIFIAATLAAGVGIAALITFGGIPISQHY